MPKASLPDFAMLSPAGNKAVAHLVAALAEQRQHDSDETSLLRWWRVRYALLMLEHAEITDTEVDEKIWRHLLTLSVSSTFVEAALDSPSPAEVLFGLQSPPQHWPGETLREMNQRVRF